MEKEKLYKVILKDAGSNKLLAVKTIKELTGLGLKEAEELMDTIPSVIANELPSYEAIKFRKTLYEGSIGSKVIITGELDSIEIDNNILKKDNSEEIESNYFQKINPKEEMPTKSCHVIVEIGGSPYNAYFNADLITFKIKGSSYFDREAADCWYKPI